MIFIVAAANQKLYEALRQDLLHPDRPLLIKYLTGSVADDPRPGRPPID